MQSQLSESTPLMNIDPEIFNTSLKDCIAALIQGLTPSEDMNIWQYSDKHRILTSAASGEPGPWRTSRVPYTREIMEELSTACHTEDIVFMKGSQVAGTETMINALQYYIDREPGPILAVQPTIEMAKKFSRQRLQPTFDSCESLKGKISDHKSRDTSNTILQKDFYGGTLVLGGANSAAALRSMPVRYLLMDEIDAYPMDVDGEGDPVDLAIKRTTNFKRRKRLFVSTPTVDGTSRIQKKFEESDQRYYYVPCPHCNKPQIIKWERIRYIENDPKSVYLECDHCQAAIYEYHKDFMLTNGRWIKHNPKSKVAGFHLSALYSPLGWYSWEEAVSDHLKARGDPFRRKVWVNTVLGEVWQSVESTIDRHWLAKRREKYRAIVPAEVLCLTAGVDTQDDRLECTVIGWGQHGESWVIDHAQFMGSTKQNSVWDLLNVHLLTQWEHERGVCLNIACTCVDSGGHSTDEVYAFCRAHQYRRIYPIKGQAGIGKSIIHSARKNDRAGIYLWHIGVDQAKDFIYSNLHIKDPGPGYIHFPHDLEERYFEQITAEHKITRHSAGMPKPQWVLPPGKRNEALDCYVYALGALKILNPNLEQMAKENIVFTSDFNAAAVRRQRRVISQGVS